MQNDYESILIISPVEVFVFGWKSVHCNAASRSFLSICTWPVLHTLNSCISLNPNCIWLMMWYFWQWTAAWFHWNHTESVWLPCTNYACRYSGIVYLFQTCHPSVCLVWTMLTTSVHGSIHWGTRTHASCLISQKKKKTPLRTTGRSLGSMWEGLRLRIWVWQESTAMLPAGSTYCGRGGGRCRCQERESHVTEVSMLISSTYLSFIVQNC